MKKKICEEMNEIISLSFMSLKSLDDEQFLRNAFKDIIKISQRTIKLSVKMQNRLEKYRESIEKLGFVRKK